MTKTAGLTRAGDVLPVSARPPRALRKVVFSELTGLVAGDAGTLVEFVQTAGLPPRGRLRQRRR